MMDMDSKTYYPLTVTVTEKNGFLHIHLATSPSTREERHNSILGPTHPFAFLDRELEASSRTAKYIIDSFSDAKLQIPDSAKRVFKLIKDEHDFKDEELDMGNYTQIVADNPVTRGIVDMIKDFSQVEKFSGNSSPNWYRASLISALDSLWD